MAAIAERFVIAEPAGAESVGSRFEMEGCWMRGACHGRGGRLCDFILS